MSDFERHMNIAVSKAEDSMEDFFVNAAAALQIEGFNYSIADEYAYKDCVLGLVSSEKFDLAKIMVNKLIEAKVGYGA